MAETPRTPQPKPPGEPRRFERVKRVLSGGTGLLQRLRERRKPPNQPPLSEEDAHRKLFEKKLDTFEKMAKDANGGEKDHNVVELFNTMYDGLDYATSIQDESGEVHVFPQRRPELPNEMRPVMMITQPEEFVKEVVELSKIKEENEDDVWVNRNTLWGMWDDATVQDFQDPITFMKRIGAMMQDRETEKHLPREWKNLGEIGQLKENLFIRNVAADTHYGDHHNIEIATSATMPTEADLLHTVGFGRISPDTVILYDLQMSTIEGASKATVGKDRQAVDIIFQGVTQEYDQSPQQYSRLFGTDFMDELAQVQDSAIGIQMVINKLIELKDKEGAQGTLEAWALGKNFPRSLLGIASQHEFVGTPLSNLKADQARKVEERLEARRERQKRLTKHFKKSDYLDLERPVAKLVRNPKMKSILEAKMAALVVKKPEDSAVLSLIAAELMDVPPSAVFSLTASLEILSKMGIKRVLLPTVMPLRQAAHLRLYGDPNMDQGIFERTLKAFLRTSAEVRGFDMVDYKEDGYVEFSIGEELESARPILQQILQVVRNSQNESTS